VRHREDAPRIDRGGRRAVVDGARPGDGHGRRCSGSRASRRARRGDGGEPAPRVDRPGSANDHVAHPCRRRSSPPGMVRDGHW
jgi:hypothetical protein